jgi:hypothetical protein
MIGAGLVAMLAGCSGAVVPATGEQSEAMIVRRCPDPSTDCTSSNGTGVYTDEEGFAGLASYQLMITHFINHGSYVTFQGRFYDANAQGWFGMPNPGSVYYAVYNGQRNLLVTSITESFTVPTFTLLDNTTNNTITVTGAQLLDLQLYVSVDNPFTLKTELYVLDFDRTFTDSGKGTVRKYNMRWRPSFSTQPTQYCFDADGNPDQVVFQQGIYVNPVNAKVTRNSAIVTMSCRLGAMATVRWWGYPYRPNSNTSTDYFDAALQMKRASYCANANHYTKSGTLIQIQDDQGIQNDTVNYLEAWWTADGAKCIGKMRHPGMGFNGICNGNQLPTCDLSNRPAQYLEDGPWVLQP